MHKALTSVRLYSSSLTTITYFFGHWADDAWLMTQMQEEWSPLTKLQWRTAVMGTPAGSYFKAQDTHTA